MPLSAGVFAEVLMYGDLYTDEMAPPLPRAQAAIVVGSKKVLAGA